MKQKLLLFAVLLLSLSASAKREPVPVFLVAGQSNTDGRVPIQDLPSYIVKEKYQHCYWSYGSGAVSGKGEFELFWPRTAKKNQTNCWGYDAVVNYFLDKSLGRDFYVIKESLGGTAIDTGAKSTNNMYWSADSEYLASTDAADKGGTSLLKAFSDNIGACIDNHLSKQKGGYDIKALLWHQGESDIRKGANYYDNLKGVIGYIRQYLVDKTGNQKYAKLPVIIGGIVRSGRGYSAKIAQAQQRIAHEDPNVYLIDVQGATLRSDQLHFDAVGAEFLGRRVYNQLVRLGSAGKKAKQVSL